MKIVRGLSRWFGTWKGLVLGRDVVSAVHNDVVSRGIVSSQNLEKCVRDYHVPGLCPGIISTVISLLI